MCERFTLPDADLEGIAEQLAVPANGLKEFKPRFNIAPAAGYESAPEDSSPEALIREYAGASK